MAKKKTVTNKVAFRTVSKLPLSQEMVNWLVEHGFKEDDKIAYHDPLFVQCVEELRPRGWVVHEIKGDKYYPADFAHDAYIITPEDLALIKKSMVTIPTPEPATE